MMKSAFVTGGTGFVGSHLVEALVDRGYHVTCLVRDDPKWLKGMDVAMVRGDLGSVNVIQRAVTGCTHVFHVAGMTRARSEATLFHANVTGTIELLKADSDHAPDLQRVIVTSTLAAVGFSERLVATEESPLRPISAYGRSKARMEEAIAALQKDTSRDKLPITVVRPPAVYGPREKDIFTFVKLMSKGLAPMVGRGLQPEISLVYVGDLVKGMIDAAEHSVTEGETYFIGSEDQYSWQDVKQSVATALDRSFALTIPVPRQLVTAVGSVVEFGGRIAGKLPPLNEEKATEILKACKMCSVAKAMEDFGYRQHTSLAEGLERSISWYRENGWL